MIIQNINNVTQVIFTNDPQSDYRKVASELKYTKKDGELYQYVQRDTTTYHPKGSDKSLPVVKFEAKGVTTYIVKDQGEFYLEAIRFNSLPDIFSTYGEDYTIKIGEYSLQGPIKVRDNILITKDGKTISIDSDGSDGDSTIEEISRFIHNMSLDNGRMLYPVIKRFLNTVLLFKGNKHLLTGYVNLSQYLYTMKQPQPKFTPSKTNDISTDLVFTFDSKSYSKLKVIDVVDSVPLIQLITTHSLNQPKTTMNPTPYILITTKPIQMKNQKFPYSVVRYKGISLFISPLIFNSNKVLRDMKGGINLLK